MKINCNKSSMTFSEDTFLFSGATARSEKFDSMQQKTMSHGGRLDFMERRSRIIKPGHQLRRADGGHQSENVWAVMLRTMQN